MANPTRKSVLALALKQVGVKENPAGSNKTKYGKKYGLNGQPWCAIFVWWCIRDYVKQLWDPAYPKTAYTPDIKNFGVKHKFWKKYGDYTPKPGDLILYQMPGPARINHIGMVVEVVKGKGIKTVEGNTGGTDPRNGGMVGLQLRSTSTLKAYCKGFVALPYSPEPKVQKPAKVTISKPKEPANSEKPAKTTTTKKASTVYTLVKTLKKGIKGSAVKKLQKKLGVKADGVFGLKTEATVKKYQKAKKLKADGVVGKNTAKALGWKWGGK
jgi:hypothetical protein